MLKNIDYNMMDRFPNKYNLTPKDLVNLKVLDWDGLIKHTWHNDAMTDGDWWCHLAGSGDEGAIKFGDDTEFWIGFNKDNNKIRYHFTSFGGMCGYNFTKFYNLNEIENNIDYMCQVNTIKWLNMLIDDGILGL